MSLGGLCCFSPPQNPLEPRSLRKQWKSSSRSKAISAAVKGLKIKCSWCKAVPSSGIFLHKGGNLPVFGLERVGSKRSQIPRSDSLLVGSFTSEVTQHINVLHHGFIRLNSSVFNSWVCFYSLPVVCPAHILRSPTSCWRRCSLTSISCWRPDFTSSFRTVWCQTVINITSTRLFTVDPVLAAILDSSPSQA